METNATNSRYRIKQLLEEKVEFAKKCKYYIQKNIGCNPEYNREFEDEIEKQQEDYSSPLNMALYSFKDNFFKYIGKSLFIYTDEGWSTNNLLDYKEEAMQYLEKSYPFCFNINLMDSELYSYEPIYNLALNSAAFPLAFYSMAIGATDEQMPMIKEILKKERFQQIDSINYTSQIQFSDHEKISIDDVNGTTIEKYSYDNLFSILMAINDKNINGFVSYIMVNGGIESSNRAFDGIGIFQDQNNNLLVREGNHRIFVYKALKKIKEFITGKPIESIRIDASISRGISFPRKQSQIPPSEIENDFEIF